MNLATNYWNYWENTKNPQSTRLTNKNLLFGYILALHIWEMKFLKFNFESSKNYKIFKNKSKEICIRQLNGKIKTLLRKNKDKIEICSWVGGIQQQQKSPQHLPCC